MRPNPEPPWARASLLAAIACAALATLPVTSCAATHTDPDDTAATTTEQSGEARGADHDSAVTVDGTGANSTDRAASGETATESTETHVRAADESLNDAQILGVIKVANESEVATGQLAVQKARTPEVRDYAQDMVQDHLAAGQHVDLTATAAPPGASEMATRLVEEANERIESLNAQTGADFERAYIDGQIEAHRELLDTIESHLLPKAESADVKQLLESMREKVSDHLQLARELQQQMASIAG